MKAKKVRSSTAKEARELIARRNTNQKRHKQPNAKQRSNEDSENRLSNQNEKLRDLSLFESAALGRIRSKLAHSGQILKERNQQENNNNNGDKGNKMSVPKGLKMLEHTVDFNFSEYSSTQCNSETEVEQSTQANDITNSNSVDSKQKAQYINMQPIIDSEGSKDSYNDIEPGQRHSTKTSTRINDSRSIIPSDNDLEATKFIDSNDITHPLSKSASIVSKSEVIMTRDSSIVPSQNTEKIPNIQKEELDLDIKANGIKNVINIKQETPKKAETVHSFKSENLLSPTMRVKECDISIDKSIEPQCVSSPIASKNLKNTRESPMLKQICNVKKNIIDFDGFKSPDKSKTVMSPVPLRKSLTSRKSISTGIQKDKLASMRQDSPAKNNDKPEKKIDTGIKHRYFHENQFSAVESGSELSTNENSLYSFSKILPKIENRIKDLPESSNLTKSTISTCFNPSSSIMTRKQRKAQNISLINDHYLSYIQNAISSRKKSKYVSFVSNSPSRTLEFSDSTIIATDNQVTKKDNESQNSPQQNVCIGTGESFLKFCENVDQIKFASKLSKIYGMSQYEKTLDTAPNKTVMANSTISHTSATISDTLSKKSSQNILVNDGSEISPTSNSMNKTINMDVTSGWALPENQANQIHDITCGWLKYDTRGIVYPKILLINKPKVNPQMVSPIRSTKTQVSTNSKIIGSTNHVQKKYKKKNNTPVSNLGAEFEPTPVKTRHEFAEKFLKSSIIDNDVSFVDLSVANMMSLSHGDGDKFKELHQLSSISSGKTLIPEIDEKTVKMTNKNIKKSKKPESNKTNSDPAAPLPKQPIMTRLQKKNSKANLNHLCSVKCTDNRYNFNNQLTEVYVAKHFTNINCRVEQNHLKGNIIIYPGRSIKHNKTIESSLRTINFYVVSGRFEITDQCGNHIKFSRGEYFEIRGGTKYQIKNLNSKLVSRLYFELVPNTENASLII